MKFFNGIHWAILSAIVLSAQPAMADSWALPTPQTYESTDKTMRFQVIPSKLSSQLEYFEEKVAEDEGAEPEDRPPARGILERRNSRGRWEVVWDRLLLNEVAPTFALVSSDARYVVTFDDWHFVGTGPNTVVIYGPSGQVIRVLELSDILPEFYLNALPRSISSIDWYDDARLSSGGDELIIQLVVPEEEAETSLEYVDLRIRLSDGQIVENTSPDWEAALAQARRVSAAYEEAELRAREAFVAPLLGPNPPSEPEWHGYLREAFNRMDPNWPKGSPTTSVLRSSDAKDYLPSEGWLRQALLQEDYPHDVIMLATLSSPEYLLALIETIMAKAEKGALKTSRVYVALPLAYKDRLTAIFTVSGAELIVLDPTVPIPQRPERLRRAG